MGILSVEDAKAGLKQLEHSYRVRPSQNVIQNLAAVYFTVGDNEKALAFGKRAVELAPNDSAALLNLGMIYKEVGMHAESGECVEKASRLDPNDHYKRLAATEAQLRRGEWQKAWPLYDTARLTKEGAAIELSIPLDVKMWDGKEEVRELIVINEGGTGDRISYTRFLPELTKRGINWKFFGFNELMPFYERLPWIPKDRLLKDGDSIKPSHWTTTFSLMANLNIRPEDVPDFPSPFLAHPSAATNFKFTADDGKPVIGLAWTAAELWQGGRKIRSLGEGQAVRLAALTADLVHWVNLQPNYKMPLPFLNVPGFETWEHTAMIIHNLDAVVSVDCGTMHMAGALGKPLSILLSGNSDWKFMMDADKTVWYPKAKLYRNTGMGMEDAISKLINAIRENPKVLTEN